MTSPTRAQHAKSCATHASASSETPHLERAEGPYQGLCWRREGTLWTRYRALYRKGQLQPVALYPTGTPEDELLALLGGEAVDGPGLDTTPPARRFVAPDEISALAQGRGAEAAEEIRAALASLLDSGVLAWREPPVWRVPQRFAEVAPKRDPRVKVVRQFSDLTLLWHTARLTEIDASVDVNDNPVLAVPAWIGDAYEMMDGGRSLAAILEVLWSSHGTSCVTPERLLSVVSRLGQLGFLTPESRDDLAGAPLTWPQEEWDFDVSMVQKSYINTDLPMYVLLELTARCTRACPYCYKVSHGREKDMPDGDYLDTVLQSVIDSGITYTTLLGGEPLLRRGLLFECVRRLKEANVFAKLITNGDLVDESAAHTLSDLGLNKIELSLDGFTPESGDRFRGEGSVESVERALRNLADTEISDIGLSITVSSANYGDVVGNLSGFLDRYPHLNKIYFSRYFESPHMARVEGINELTPAQVRYLSEKIETEWKPRFRSRTGFDMAVLDAGMCSCGRSLAVLTCEGAIKPCPFTHERGTVLGPGMSFRELWHSSFNPLRMEDKATCWARKMRDRMALPMVANEPQSTPPEVESQPEACDPPSQTSVFNTAAERGDLTDAIGEALAAGTPVPDITAALHELIRSDPGLEACVKSCLDAMVAGQAPDERLAYAAERIRRWIDVGSVAFVSPEAWPVSKGGGMASAVAGRAASLAASGLKVHVITPLYTYTEVGGADGERSRVFTKDAVIARLGLKYTGDVVAVPKLGSSEGVAAVAQAMYDGVHYVVLDSPAFAEALYGYARSGEDTDSQRAGLARLVNGCLVLSLGAAKAMEALGIQPSVVVGNDWMCAPLAAALRDGGRPDPPRFVAWVHNNGVDYQFRVDRATGGGDLLQDLPVPDGRRADYVDPHEPGIANFQAALLRGADQVVAVSPQQKAAYLAGDCVGEGDGLAGLFREADARGALHGIANGIDVTSLQTACFGQCAADISDDDGMAGLLETVAERRLRARRAIAFDSPEFWPWTGGRSDELDAGSFLVTMVSRITAQKGIALVDAFERRVLDNPKYGNVRFAFAGTGDEGLVARLRSLARDFPGRVGYADRFLSEDDPSGAYRNLYLAGDLCIAFSLWEPGGLSVMESLACGVPCLVSDRQGHRDTIRSIALLKDGADEPQPNGARFPIHDGDPRATVEAALQAFDALYSLHGRSDGRWDALVRNALLSDNRWEASLGSVEALMRAAAAR